MHVFILVAESAWVIAQVTTDNVAFTPNARIVIDLTNHTRIVLNLPDKLTRKQADKVFKSISDIFVSIFIKKLYFHL